MKRRIVGLPAPAKPTEIDQPFLRQLLQLCHPDRHDSSPLSVRVFQRLIDISKELDKRTTAL